MSQQSIDLYQKLEQGPAVLFLGQEYLKLESGEDWLLAEILKKYGKRANDTQIPSYSHILSGDSSKTVEPALAWMHERCRRFSPPAWLQTVASFPWNALYTSAIDTIWQDVFRTEWRELHPLYEEKYRPVDPRNRHKLHCTYLFGSVGRCAENERPPLTIIETKRRNQVSIALARRLPEIITPFGLLLMEGYAADSDWFTPDNLLPIIDDLTPEQAHIFSAKNNIKENDCIAYLLEEKKLTLHEESLATWLLRGETSGLIRLGTHLEEKSQGRRLLIKKRVFNIPEDIWNQVSNSAIIVDDTLTLPPPTLSIEKQRFEFRNFLSQGSLNPIWAGYGMNFGFRRGFEQELYEQAMKRLTAKEVPDKALIVHGQTGAGKTIALGSLAYRIGRDKNYPVLYIGRRSLKPISVDIDLFCRWVESCEIGPTLVIWDSMTEVSQYHRFLRQLLGLGRKVVLIGSSYRIEPLPKAEDFILAPAELSSEELKNFSEFLDNNLGKALSEQIIKQKKRADNSFLVSLYRSLPDSRSLIQEGIVKEVGMAEEGIELEINKGKIKKAFGSILAAAMLKAGIITQAEVAVTSVKEIGGENVSEAQELIGLVMTPGQFGNFVPIELLLRSLNKNDIVGFVETLKRLDIFRWYEDRAGDISIGPRAALEAELLVQARLGGPQTEIEFAKRLLSEIRVSESEVDNSELNFAINLIKNLGPNSSKATYYAFYFRDLSESLSKLREERGIVHPRLVLQETTLLREWVIAEKKLGREPSDIENLFNKAEATLHQAINTIAHHGRFNALRSQLLVELGAVLGAKIITSLAYSTPQHELVQIYKSVRTHLFRARALDPEDYFPIDIMCWVAVALLESDALDEETKAEVEADITHVFGLCEDEEFDPIQHERLLSRRVQLGDLIENDELSNDAFSKLASQGSSAGYYLRALKLAGKLPKPEDDQFLSQGQTSQCLSAINYLRSNFDAVEKDGRCLYLYLRLWWMSNIGKPMFSGLRQPVNLNQEQWEECCNIILKLIEVEQEFLKPTIKYLYGLASFHLGRYQTSEQVFHELSMESSGSQGRRRLLRSYLASTAKGTPKLYDGIVSSIDGRGIKGTINVEELRRNIPFFLREFDLLDVKKGAAVNGFHIAFNFIGPLADPKTYFTIHKKEGRS